MHDQKEPSQAWYRDQNEDQKPTMGMLDPLTVRPRLSSRLLCLLFGLLMLVLSAGIWWLAVCTPTGQWYEDMAITNFTGFVDHTPIIKAYLGIFTIPKLTIILCILIGLIALLLVLVRRRWWLLGQVAVFSLLSYALYKLLKQVLPRPFLIHLNSSTKNSAPSGHTLMALTVVLVLIFTVPRAWRALSGLVGFAFVLSVGCSLIQGGWHRPSDVLMSALIGGGLGLITLAFTRSSGMDQPGTRASSASIQVLSTVMITAGILGCLYAGFVIWQIFPGLEISARWTFYGIHCSAVILIASILSLVIGLALALRQITASPLTRLGLVGEPPTPPEQY